jgi:hypothetical protein
MASRDLPIIIASGGAGLILLLTTPVILRFVHSRSPTGYSTLSDISSSNTVYKDEDGTATLDSEAAYSSKSSKVIVYMATPLGFAASLASAVLSTIRPVKTVSTQPLLVIDWINFTAWVRDLRHLQ